MLPATFGEHYTIEHEIGRGGMAAVYRAHDKRQQSAGCSKGSRPRACREQGKGVAADTYYPKPSNNP
jgi:hypothetical protein